MAATSLQRRYTLDDEASNILALEATVNALHEIATNIRTNLTDREHEDIVGLTIAVRNCATLLIGVCQHIFPIQLVAKA